MRKAVSWKSLTAIFSDVCEEKHTHADINKVTDFDDMFMKAPMEHTRHMLRYRTDATASAHIV